MTWSEHSIFTDTIICDTPLGEMTIETNLWHESKSFIIYINGIWIDVTDSLEDAKSLAKLYLSNKSKELIDYLTE